MKHIIFKSSNVEQEVNRLAACDSKIAYPSRSRAEKAAISMNKKYWPQTFNFYYCEHCNKWHVGHKPRFSKER